MATNAAELRSGGGVRKLPKWAPYVGVGLAGLAFLVWRRNRSSAATSSAAPASLSGGNAGGGVGTSSGYSAAGYGAPAPVSVLPPLTLGGTSTDDNTQQYIPPPIRSFPPAGGGGTQPAPSIPTQTPPPQPTAQPTAQPVNLPQDLVNRIQAGGEQLIGNMIDPQTGGTWWFGSHGGVFAVNGARFLGSVPGVGAYFPGLNIVSFQPSGSGYRLTASGGQNYNFPS